MEDIMGNMAKQNDYRSSSVRTVQADAYLSDMNELIARGYEVAITVTGGSMVPFLVHGRDQVYFGPIQKPLKHGDVVFYKRTDGKFVMHRICNIRKGNEYYLIGDAQKQKEGPIFREQIFAVVLAVKRKGEWIDSSSPVWKFFQHVWVRLVPFRGIIMKVYSLVQRGRKHD